MYQSGAVHSEALPPLPSAVRKSTSHSHHGTAAEATNNGRSNGFERNGLPPKPQDQSSVNSSDPGLKTVTLNPPQPQPQKPHESQIKTLQTHETTPGQNPIQNGGGGDVLLQWGQRKRSKRTVADKFSSGISMHPPRPPPAASGAGSRGSGKLRPTCNGALYSKDPSPRKLEDRMGAGGATNGSPTPAKSNGGSRSIPRSSLGKRSHSTAEKTDSKKPPHHHQHHPPPPPKGSGGASTRKDKSTDSMSQSEHPNGHHNHLPSPLRGEEDAKGNGDAVVEWPRIYIALSRKEKEDDFFAMKGTKLPHRPKKRSKAVDRVLQYCFPGTFLSDLSRARYEVRERKSVKKPKRRGLKGLENMESESD